MMRIIGFILLAAVGLLQGRAQHYHLNAGATAPAAGTKLLFHNGGDYDTNAAFIVKLQKNAASGFNGDFVGNISMTSLSADPLAPEPGHGAPGAFLQVEIVSVHGPAGGTISFWDNNIAVDELIFSIPSGLNDGTNRVALSEGDGSPGSDPYGHIHGRNWSANMAGLYTVGMRIIDTSTNGENGGSLHEPSDPFFIHFQAGITLQLEVDEGKVRVRYPATTGIAWKLEKAGELGAEWETAVDAIAGDDHLHEYLTDAGSEGYFRIIGTLP